MQTAKNLKGLFDFIKQGITRILFFMSCGLVCACRCHIGKKKFESAFQNGSDDYARIACLYGVARGTLKQTATL